LPKKWKTSRLPQFLSQFLPLLTLRVFRALNPLGGAGFHRRLEFLTESKIPAATMSKKPTITQWAPTNRNALAEIARKRSIHASHPNADNGPPCPVLPQPHRLLHRGCSAMTLAAIPKKRKIQPRPAQPGSRQLIPSTVQIMRLQIAGFKNGLF
jgi:hypothetical protein